MTNAHAPPRLSWIVVATFCLGLTASGCQLPDWGPPGTMDAQRARAMQHDPYPSTELGPEIMGARPRDFDLPRAEVTQLQTSPTARRGPAFQPAGF